MSVLRGEHLAKSYKTRKVVTDLSLEVHAGEVVGLLGPNGAGKTTAFYMIVGLVPADAGSVFLDDRDLSGAPMHERARAGVGYLPQEASVFRKLSVEDNVMGILELRDDLDAAGRQQRLEHILADLRIGHVRESRWECRCRVANGAVPRSRALWPPSLGFILLDEPFAGVDPISVADIQRIVRELANRGIGVLITDHNVRETLGFAAARISSDGGTVIAAGSAEEILANPQVREVYLGENVSHVNNAESQPAATLGQQLTMTPQLQQAIRLLQLPPSTSGPYARAARNQCHAGGRGRNRGHRRSSRPWILTRRHRATKAPSPTAVTRSPATSKPLSRPSTRPLKWISSKRFGPMHNGRQR